MSDNPWRSFTDDLSQPGGRKPGSSRGNPVPGWLFEVARTLGTMDSKNLGNLGGSFTGSGKPGGFPNFQRGPKVRRGDVRTAILDVLSTGPLNGYQVIQAIAERTDGAWKPSSGSVYPTIQQLEDEGLVTGVEIDGRRLLELTGAGRAWVGEHAEAMAATWKPFEAPQEGEDGEPTGEWAGFASLGENFAHLGSVATPLTQLIGATVQVIANGTSQQRAEAVELLDEARRRMSGLIEEEDK